MKKLIYFLLLFLLFPSLVFAGGNKDDKTDLNIVDKCQNSSIGCAFCVYDFSEENTGCYTKFSVTYKNNNTKLEYETYSSGGGKSNLSCNFSYSNFSKSDFVDSNGNIKCPKLIFETKFTNPTGTVVQEEIIFKAGPNGTLESTTNSNITNSSNTGNSNTLEQQSCESLLGSPTNDKSPAFFLVIVFKVIKYVAILLLIVVTTMDFVSAVAASDNDALKKAASKAITRAILCIIIFVLPTIIEFVLQFLSDEAASTCGIGG